MDWLSLAITGGSGLLGGLFGMGDYFNKVDSNNAAVDRQLKIMDLEWAATQQNAFDKADRENRNATVNEKILGIDANAGIGNISSTQEQQALQYNNALQNIGANEGSANASLAQSGTRNSSALNAVEMQTENNLNTLQSQEDMDRANNDYNLARAMGNIENGVNSLQDVRTDALNMRKEYSSGGAQEQIYKLQRENLAAKKMDDSFWGKTLGAISSFFGGVAGGMQTGAQVADFGKNYFDWQTKAQAQDVTFNQDNLNFTTGSFLENDPYGNNLNYQYNWWD